MNKTFRDTLVEDFMDWYKDEVMSMRDELVQTVPSEEISSIGGPASTEVILKSATKLINKLNSWDSYEKIVDNIHSLEGKEVAEMVNRTLDPKKNLIEKGIVVALLSRTLRAVKNVLSLMDTFIMKIGRDTIYDDSSFNDALYIFHRKVDSWLPKLKSLFNDEFKEFKPDIEKELNAVLSNTNIDQTIENWKFICFFIENKLPSFYLMRKMKVNTFDDAGSISEKEFEKELESLEKLFSETNMEALKTITNDCNKLSPLFSYMDIFIKNNKKS